MNGKRRVGKASKTQDHKNIQLDTCTTWEKQIYRLIHGNILKANINTGWLKNKIPVGHNPKHMANANIAQILNVTCTQIYV
jgi:hypothetical protein